MNCSNIWKNRRKTIHYNSWKIYISNMSTLSCTGQYQLLKNMKNRLKTVHYSSIQQHIMMNLITQSTVQKHEKLGWKLYVTATYHDELENINLSKNYHQQQHILIILQTTLHIITCLTPSRTHNKSYASTMQL